MKHKTLRTLLCVILTVCFCLSAIAPVSAAGLFSGDTGAANIFDEWIRSLKDRFIEKNPGTDETPAEPMEGTGEEFIRIFHLDCGRKYFTVDQIEGIIDQLAANNYTHIELAFGNDGFRFLLDNMAVTVDGKTYSHDDVKASIQAGNSAYNNECKNNYNPSINELDQREMDEIISHANEKNIGVIPMIDVPGHTKTLIEAMTALEIAVDSKTTGNNNAGNPMHAFKAGDNAATRFAVALVKKYVDYFYSNGSKYFNIAGDECGDTSFVKVDEIVPNLITPLSSYIKSKNMTPMMFNDAFRTDNTLKTTLQGSGIVICYWTNGDKYDKVETLANTYGYSIINTHNKWYYVAGKEKPTSFDWAGKAFSYTWALSNMTNNGEPGEGDFHDCTACDGNYYTKTGCMLAYWCDNPAATYDEDEKTRVSTLIQTLANQNPTYFKAPVTPAAPTITVSANSLTVDGTATLSTSDGSLATWASSDEKVLEVVATKDVVATTKDVTAASVTVRAVGAGTATVTAKLSDGTTLTSETITVRNKGEVTNEKRTVTVTAGGTTTDTITGTNYAGGNWSTEDSSIATISVTGKDASATDSYTSVSVKASELAGDNTTATATEYYTKVYNQYVQVYAYKQSDSWGTTYYYWGYMSNDRFRRIDYSSYGNTPVSLYKKEDPTASTTVTFTGAVGAAGKTTYAIVGNVRYTINVTAENLSSVTPLPIQLWITNNTIQVDGTSATKTGSGWGGNAAAGYKANYVNVTAQSAYGENGISLYNAIGLNEPLVRYEYGGTRYINYSDLPEQDGRSSQNLVLWTGRIHNKADGNVQTMWGADGNSDYSNSGSAFNYVRYYGGAWAVSADGKTGWTTVTGAGSTGTYSGCTQQLAAYYMIRTDITEEVKTDVADWGEPKDSTKYNEQVASDFVLLDFAVKYEDGSQNPKENAFPVANKTMAFHCNNSSTDSAIGGSGNTRYRKLNNFRAANTGDYEVYMVTVTMTNALASEQLTENDALSSYTYDKKTEQIVWAIDEATLDNSNLTAYTPISGTDSVYAGCTIGGDPYVRGVEVYLNHGALITYYVRAKTGALTVHYHDRTRNDQEFYNYNIVVNAGTFFDPNFRQKAPNSLELENHIVKNKYNVDQAVSADLITMRGIPAQYRYSKYTCVKVELVTPDGAGGPTEVHLYYTFSADVSFVVDFGLPLTIPYTELNENLKNEEVKITSIIASSPVFGSVKVNGTSGITYTPNKTLDQIDSFKVACTGTIPVKSENGTTTYQEGTVEYTVHIIPATNVLYEETFITNPENSGWTNTATADSVEQTLEKSGNKQNVYGFDTKIENYYLGNPDGGKDITYSMGNALTTTLSIPAGAKEAIIEKPLTFSFKGTGFDLISKCSDKTGILLVYIKGTKLNANGKPYQGVFLVDTYFAGDNAPEGGTAIMAKGTTVYQVPVVREFGAFNKKYDDTLTENAGLPYDTYQVSVYAYLNNNAGVFENNAAAVASYNAEPVSDNNIIADALAACNITGIDADQVKLVYMDENSILNGGTGAAVEQRANIATMASLNAVDTATVNSAEVYVDAFRVYNPLGDTTVQIGNKASTSAEKNEVQAYENDSESGVKYMSLYDFVVGNLGSYGNETGGTSSSVYVEYDGNKPAEEQIVGKEYKVHGPQNEIYLAKGCGIAFHINELSDGQTIQISAKAVDGFPTFNGSDVTATEMYYDLTSMTNALTGTGTGKDVVIYNNGDGVLAISGLKCSATITITANSSATQAAINTIRYAMSAKDASYAPATFEITAPETARRNRSIGIGVTATATDVDSMKIQVMCDGVVVSEETTLYPYNVKAVEQGKATNYYYSKSYRFAKAGTYVFTATAFDGNGNSYSIEKTVVVK